MVTQALADLHSLDLLRPHRLRKLLGKGDDTEMALGIDVYAFCPDADALLKITSKGTSLEVLGQALSSRFNRSDKAKSETIPAPNDCRELSCDDRKLDMNSPALIVRIRPVQIHSRQAQRQVIKANTDCRKSKRIGVIAKSGSCKALSDSLEAKRLGFEAGHVCV